MKRRKILTAIALFVLGWALYLTYIFYIDNNDNIKSIYLVPEDAVYVIESQEPIDNWDAVSKSDIWKHLNTNTYFNKLAENLNRLDTIFRQEKSFFNRIGNRDILISAHVYKPKDYSFFYVIDLQKIAKLNLLKNHLNTITNSNYKVSKRKYHNHEIVEVYDKKNRTTLHISFIKNQMIASYVHTLVEASIDQYLQPQIGRNLDFIEVEKEVGYGDMFRLYFQYKYLDKFVNIFTDDTGSFVNTLSKSLAFSGFNFNLEDNTIIANGTTNFNEEANVYLKALQRSGKSTRTITEVAPKQTALYLSFSFDSFKEFYENFEGVLNENPEEFKNYLDGTEQIENFLKIDLKKDFMSWIDDEIALLQLHSTVSESKKDIAFVLKTTDSNEAQQNLNFILEQIRKRSPVKFKEVNYKGYAINFMSIKGFFKILLGNLFKDIDKPYFTIIDDYVVFSNQPNTLKTIINNYIAENTLDKFETFENFNDNFNRRCSAFVYVNTPNLYNSAYNFVDKTSRKALKTNKDYFICFPQMGVQLTPESDFFKSKIVLDYEAPELVKTKYNFIDVPEKPEKNNSKWSSELTEDNIDKATVFNIREIFPSDLTAKSFTKTYRNGNLKFTVVLKNGLKHGDYKAYYSNGKLKISGKYKKDKQVGTWKAYNFNKDVIYKKRF